MNRTTKVLIVLALLAVSFGVGYFATPTKVKTEVKEVVKIVKEEQKTKIVYREKIVYPDGTTVEKEQEREDTNTRESSDTTRTAVKETTKDIGLVLSALAIVDSSEISGHRDYGIHVTKRVFSSITVGVMATTDKKIGVSIGLSF
jgi:hypothetical protein